MNDQVGSLAFPRLPLTGNLELFRALARLGGGLVALHLLESLQFNRPITGFCFEERARLGRWFGRPRPNFRAEREGAFRNARGGRAPQPEVEKISWFKDAAAIKKTVAGR